MNDIVQRLLEKSIYCTVTTINHDGSPWASPVHFAYDDKNIYWLSSPDAQHSRNIERDNRVCINVFDSHQVFSSNDERGAVYISSWASVLDGDDALAARDVYADRFGDENNRRLSEWSVYSVPIGEIDNGKTQGGLVYLRTQGVNQ